MFRKYMFIATIMVGITATVTVSSANALGAPWAGTALIVGMSVVVVMYAGVIMSIIADGL